MTSLIIDLIALLIIILIIVISAKRGFLSGVVSFVGWIVSVLAANQLCKPAANYIYSNLVRSRVHDAVLNSLDGASASLSSSYSDILNLLPESIKNLIGGETAQEAINAVLGSSAGAAPETTAQALTDEVIGPIIITLLSAVAFIIIFLVCSLVVKLLSGVFRGVHKIPIIGPLNTMLGAVIGAVEAVILLYVIGVAIRFLITASGGSLFGLTAEDFNNTYTYNILNFNFRGLL